MVNNAVPSVKLGVYERVSTARQGRSGLGLEALRKAIDGFAASKIAILARFTEVESGRKTGRPGLVKALNLANLSGATLVIAKLDPLSRNAAFCSRSMAAGCASSPATWQRRAT